MENNIVIHTEELTKTFGNFTAVDHISFDVRRGEIFGFLGANGAGKTTVFNMLTGVYTPNDGSITYFGRRSGGWFRYCPAIRGREKKYRVYESEIFSLRRSQSMGEFTPFWRNLRYENENDRVGDRPYIARIGL